MWEDFIDVLVDILLWFPRMIYSLIASAVEWFMLLLPDTGLDIEGALSGWSGDVLYFLTLFEVPYGIAALFTCLGARFMLRRIPGIG